jgi:hypothetical protein
MNVSAKQVTQTSTTKVEPVKPAPAYKPHIYWRDRAFVLSYWTETGLEKESLLQAVMDFFMLHKYFISVDQGWSDWDLEIYRGMWSKAQVKVCTENHGGNKRLLRVRCTLRVSQFAAIATIGYLFLIVVQAILGIPELAAATVVVGAFNAVVILYQNFRLGRTIYQVLETVAKKKSLLPVHANSTKFATQPTLQS